MYKAGFMQRRRVHTPKCKEGTALRLLRGESRREDSEGLHSRREKGHEPRNKR